MCVWEWVSEYIVTWHWMGRWLTLVGKVPSTLPPWLVEVGCGCGCCGMFQDVIFLHRKEGLGKRTYKVLGLECSKNGPTHKRVASRRAGGLPWIRSEQLWSKQTVVEQWTMGEQRVDYRDSETKSTWVNLRDNELVRVWEQGAIEWPSVVLTAESCVWRAPN